MASPAVPEDAIKQKVIDILKENPGIPRLQSFTSKPDGVTLEQDSLLTEGFVNFLLRMRASDGSTAIVKYVPPYAKEYGPGAPLSQGRAEIEMTALQLFEQHSPGSAPKPYFYSQKHSIILMEDLSGYVMLKTELLAGNISKLAVEKVAVHMAKIHKSTHKDNIDAQEWSMLQHINKELPMIEEMAQMFTSYPYIKEPKDEVSRRLKEIADSRVLGNNSLNGVIDQCIREYVSKKECLIHGDTHTKDLLVKGDDAKMIDPEFAHLGPCSGDVAMLLAHLVMAYYYHLVSPEENDKHRQVAYKIQDCCSHLVNVYLENMTWKTGSRTEHVNKLLQDVAAFSGVELFRSVCSGEQSTLGLSQVEMVEAGIRLMQHYHNVNSVDKMIYIALALG